MPDTDLILDYIVNMQNIPDGRDTSPDSRSLRLAELEKLWNEKFVQQPKLPTSALLTGALSMALAFGAVLFFLFKWVRGYAWIWVVLSVVAGLFNRKFAHDWYTHVVVPWDADRRATAAEIASLKQSLKGE